MAGRSITVASRRLDKLCLVRLSGTDAFLDAEYTITFSDGTTQAKTRRRLVNGSSPSSIKTAVRNLLEDAEADLITQEGV